MQQEFKHLFTPLKVGKVTIPNRIFSSAHITRFHSPFGAPGERAVQYYEARAKGGVGLIIVGENYIVWPTTWARPTAYESDTVIPAWKTMVDAIHQHGTKVFCQLEHPGNLANVRAAQGGSILSASAIPRREPFTPGRNEIPHEIDVEDIKRVVETFGQAARRVKEAGCDGVEVTAMFGKLGASFLSPLSNKRTDAYGGNLGNRMRFLLEVIDSIRENAGPDLVLGVRLTADEFLDGGITLDDAKEIAQRLEATGKLDYLFPCAAAQGPPHTPPMYYPLAGFVYLAAGIKEVVNLPIFCAGRINDPVLAEKILADHQADMTAMTRTTICDPEMPNKAREGRLDEIRRCISCNEGCIGRSDLLFLPLSCAFNPEAGREKVFEVTLVASQKRVMVIGGGAAGLETARVAATRGHKVSLYEKGDMLAKELTIAAKSPGREDFEEVVRYYTYQMKLLGVDVHLEVNVTPEMVLKENADAVVVATGAAPYIPDVPGANGENVVEMRQVIQDEVEVGQNVVVADCQSHIYGLDTADILADRGKMVELLTESVYAGGQVDNYTIEAIYAIVLGKGVVITPLTGVKEIKGNTVIAYNMLTGAEREIEGVDTVVFCTAGMANDSLYRSLKGKVKELYQVGQCVSPRKLLDSIYDGAVVGRKI